MKLKYIFNKLLVAVLLFMSQSLTSQDVTVTVNNACFGQPTGSIELEIVPGFIPLPWTGEWENLTTGDYETFTINNTFHLLDDLPIGDYEIIIQVDETCYIEITETIIELDEITLEAEITRPTYPNCNNGEIDLTINGGDAPYDVYWSRRSNFGWWQSVQFNSGIQGNNDGEDLDGNVQSNFMYRVDVTDANGCVVTAYYRIYCECAEGCEMDADVVHATCNSGGHISSLELNCDNGPLNLQGATYLWSNGSTEPFLEDVEPGLYCVTISVPASFFRTCDYTECFDIEGNAQLEADITGYDNVSECDSDGNAAVGCDGSVDISVSGGTSPYSYQWSNGQTSQNATGLCPGTYTVTITDAAGCQRILSQEICCCYAWLDGTDGGDGDVVAGDCFGSEEDDFSPQLLNVSGQANSQNGSISVSITGGTGYLVCAWTGPNGYTNNTCGSISGLEPGTYCLSVDDGCNEDQECWTIVDCDTYSININADITNTCQGFSAGSITVSTTNGIAPFNYSWGSNTLSNLSVGTYCVTVTDGTGCTDSDCFDVGLKPLDEQVITCGWEYSCNGQFSHFIESTDYFSSPGGNCYLNVHCALTGQVIGFQNVSLGPYRYNWGQCTVEGYCPVTGQWVTVGFGQIHTQVEYWELPPTPECQKCVGCFEVTYCIMDGNAVMIDYRQIACLKGGNLDVENMRMREFTYLMKYHNSIPEKTVIMYPEGTDQFLTVKEYFSKVKEIRAELERTGEKYSRVVPLPLDEEAQELDCKRVSCRGGDGDLDSRSAQAEQTNQTNVYPNPFNENIALEINNLDLEKVNVKIFNVMGQEMLSEDYTLTKGMNIINITTNDFTSGVYIFKVSSSENLISTHSIVKE